MEPPLIAENQSPHIYDNLDDAEGMGEKEMSLVSYSSESSCGSDSCDSLNCPSKLNGRSLDNENENDENMDVENAEKVQDVESTKENESEKEKVKEEDKDDGDKKEISEKKQEVLDNDKEKEADKGEIKEENVKKEYIDAEPNVLLQEVPLIPETTEKSKETDILTSDWEVIVKPKQSTSGKRSPKEEENSHGCKFYFRRSDLSLKDDDDDNYKDAPWVLMNNTEGKWTVSGKLDFKSNFKVEEKTATFFYIKRPRLPDPNDEQKAIVEKKKKEEKEEMKKEHAADEAFDQAVPLFQSCPKRPNTVNESACAVRVKKPPRRFSN